jgi:hypothetical protein
MFAGVLAGRWPPAATLVDRLLGPEHALPLRPATDRAVWDPGGTVDPCTVEVIAAVAADERGTQWPAATARAYARHHTVTITDDWLHTGTPERPSVLHYLPDGVLVRSLGGHLVHIGVPDGIPADLKSCELTDPMLCDVRGERITRLDPTVAARAGTLTIHLTEATR